VFKFPFSDDVSGIPVKYVDLGYKDIPTPIFHLCNICTPLPPSPHIHRLCPQLRRPGRHPVSHRPMRASPPITTMSLTSSPPRVSGAARVSIIDFSFIDDYESHPCIQPRIRVLAARGNW
jgi:hypothetical protein